MSRRATERLPPAFHDHQWTSLRTRQVECLLKALKDSALATRLNTPFKHQSHIKTNKKSWRKFSVPTLWWNELIQTVALPNNTIPWTIQLTRIQAYIHTTLREEIRPNKSAGRRQTRKRHLNNTQIKCHLKLRVANKGKVVQTRLNTLTTQMDEELHIPTTQLKSMRTL